MSFEIRDRDMLARLGKIRTKSGTIETPILLPVVNPNFQTVSPKTLSNEYQCNALITNAYILKKKWGTEAEDKGIHKLLGFDGAVMTDSGAYQILVYGKVDSSPEEIVHYQEEISSDIATIMDIPTSWRSTREYAKHTVDETITRARQLTKIKTRNNILWVAPIQGGQHLDLVAYSAKQVGKLPFQIHALGSPTTIMEQYRFDILVEMILTAKVNMPLQRPLHLFGAGHPFMFALAVAIGCDLFDSAAYALYARQDRYMTEYGTCRLNELKFFPCSCPICTKNTPADVVDMPTERKQQALAMHNLHSSFAEMKRVKQKIVEGRMWEYLEAKAHSHPSLLQAVKRIGKYADYIERHSPATKRKGLFYFSSLGLRRPELLRYRKLLKERYLPPSASKILVLIPQPSKRPYHKAKETKVLVRKVRGLLEKHAALHICVYAAPFGVVPLELDEVYPLSQHEIALPLDVETVDYVVEQVESYIAKSPHRRAVVIEDDEMWKGRFSEIHKRIKRKDLSIAVIGVEELLNDSASYRFEAFQK